MLKTTDKKLKAERFGRLGEALAAAVLLCKGYRVLERRWRSPAGEIDIIAQKSGVLIAVEVKARQGLEQGMHALRPAQVARQWSALSHYAAYKKLEPEGMRLDLIVARPWRLLYHLPDAARP